MLWSKRHMSPYWFDLLFPRNSIKTNCIVHHHEVCPLFSSGGAQTFSGISLPKIEIILCLILNKISNQLDCLVSKIGAVQLVFIVDAIRLSPWLGSIIFTWPIFEPLLTYDVFLHFYTTRVNSAFSWTSFGPGRSDGTGLLPPTFLFRCSDVSMYIDLIEMFTKLGSLLICQHIWHFDWSSVSSAHFMKITHVKRKTAPSLIEPCLSKFFCPQQLSAILCFL